MPEKNDTSLQITKTNPESEQSSNQPISQSFTEEEHRERVAKMAYYNAERRGFSGDHALDDWLEAERQVGGSYLQDDQISVSQAIAESDLVINSDDPRDREIIAPDAVKKWGKELGVSVTTLRVAIKRVGSRVEDVKSFLSGNP